MMREPEPRRPPSRRRRHHRQDRRHRQVLAAQDVALADLPALEREQVPLGHVVDMDDVEAGIDIGRHPPECGVADHPPGRRRLDVARADRRRRVDDHRRHALLAHQLQHRLLGQVFGALVGADDLVRMHLGQLVPRRAVADQAERGDAAAIDDPLGARRLRRQQQVPRAVHIGPQHGIGVRHPEPIVGGDVEHGAAAADRGGEGGGIGEVALDQLGVEPGHVAPVAAPPHQQPQAVPTRGERARHRRAHEPRRAGDQARAARRRER